MSPDPYDWGAADVPTPVVQFVRDEVRPFLTAHRDESLQALTLWLAQRAERVSLRDARDRRRQEWLNTPAFDTHRDWMGAEPPTPGYVLIRGKVAGELRDCWGPPELNEEIPLNDPIPLPVDRDLTTDECWVVLLAVHDECRRPAEQIVGEDVGGVPFAALRSNCWRLQGKGDRVWIVEETDIRRVLAQTLECEAHDACSEQSPAAVAVASPAGATERGAGEKPDWIRERFQRQQYKLLNNLWGKRDVPATELITLLGYTGSPDPLGTLLRRVSATNDGLSDKARNIGEQWEISRRTRDDELFFYLHRIST